MEKPELQALPKIKDRITFLYLEHCVVNRQDGAITVADTRGIVHVPAAAISVLMLGPGTDVTHRAMELLGDAGATVLWVGERGVRYYAHGRPLTHSARLLIKQAQLVSNVRTRVAVARQMYQMRFPNEDVSEFTMQQLRGREGARIRAIYKKYSKETEIPWNGRNYDPNNLESGDLVNQALSIANYCLYGVIHSVIVALGCSPGLGFVHNNHDRAFVYDVADLYKAQITIPIAFIMAKKNPEDLEGETRRSVRNAIVQFKILERATHDIKWLLLGNDTQSFDEESDNFSDIGVLNLWDDREGCVKSGISYGKHQYDDDATDESVMNDLAALEEMLPSQESNGKIIDDKPGLASQRTVYEDDYFAELDFALLDDKNANTDFDPETFISIDEYIKNDNTDDNTCSSSSKTTPDKG
ncbi:MAG: type I-E CRISPR-associated endonuclease Cas1 [Proteobacteria bacterium]|nr:type I-E CRISPR-associated endonuclease Cas1 [Pseudomonadota bacterium]